MTYFSEELLIEHCSPTLAGIKTGNMFGCYFSSQKDMTEQVRKLNHLLKKKGILVVPLCYQNGRAMIYVYRPKQLGEDLENKLSEQILGECGYSAATTNQCICMLRSRMTNEEEFPHEVGLFLGYPPKDVYGFICQGAGKCLCCGYWKVYTDVEAAQEKFGRYKKCSDTYRRLYLNGKSIEELTVAC